MAISSATELGASTLANRLCVPLLEWHADPPPARSPKVAEYSVKDLLRQRFKVQPNIDDPFSVRNLTEILLVEKAQIGLHPQRHQISFSCGVVIFRSGLWRCASTISGTSVCSPFHIGSSMLSNTSRSFLPQLLCIILK